MTPFMHRVHEILAGDSPNRPALRPTVVRCVGEGTHEQVELRALAEQLVSEANAVLAAVPEEVLRLVDGSGTRDQEFTVSYRDSWATVLTSFDQGMARTSLTGSILSEPERELDGAEAFADLITTLIVSASERAEGRRPGI